MPVHTAYAVPKGSDRSASAINRKLSAIAISVATVGQNRVNPSEYFNPSAHPTSSTPAPSSASHAFTTFSFPCELQLHSASGGGRHFPDHAQGDPESSMRCSRDTHMTGKRAASAAGLSQN
jgi:hypothetical protein